MTRGCAFWYSNSQLFLRDRPWPHDLRPQIMMQAAPIQIHMLFSLPAHMISFINPKDGFCKPIACLCRVTAGLGDMSRGRSPTAAI